MKVPTTDSHIGAALRTVAGIVLPRGVYGRVAAAARRSRIPRVSPMASRRQWNVNQRETYVWFELAQKYVQVNRLEGVYAEFGCHGANTFRFALNTLGRYDIPNTLQHFYAFDSFEGMPEPKGIDQQRIWKKGVNTTTVEWFRDVCRDDLDRLTIVKGFFEDSLPKVRWPTEHKIAVAYVDVDYYSSTREVLAFIRDKLQHGAIIAFDDWNCYYADSERGQRRAFKEFREELQDVACFEEFRPISFGGTSFIYQELGKIGQAVL